MQKRFYLLLSLLLMFLLGLLAACGGEAPTPTAAPADAETNTTSTESAEPATTETTIRLMTHDSFEISAETLEALQNEHGIIVEVLKSGDGGQALNQAILSKEDPLADVFFGVDNTFLSRALENDVFIAYESPQLANVPDALKLDEQNRALPVDFGDVCLNYDKVWFAENGLEPPQTLEDLADPAYESLTVVENPATSTPGLAFLLTTIDHFGEDAYLDYWMQLVENDVLVTNGWTEAYYGEFTAASDGTRPIVVSYASSPPAEVFFAETELDDAPTAAVLTDGTCFRQIEFVGILNGTEHEAAAQTLVDFMLSETFQEDIPLNMFVYPANENAALPDVFTQYGTIAENPATLDPQTIADNREAWIESWTQTVLR